MNSPVELYKTYDPLEADRIADLLADHGIWCAVRDLTMSPYPMTIGRFGERRISVAPQDRERAREVLEDAIRDGYVSRDGAWIEDGHESPPPRRRA
ncbi:MAG TPA: DUF2007 domain-containing protein, partial [Nitrospiria bacterium]|nr:DUF2007 domain-containing protein [Nitrospiria bacterium]